MNNYRCIQCSENYEFEPSDVEKFGKFIVDEIFSCHKCTAARKLLLEQEEHQRLMEAEKNSLELSYSVLNRKDGDIRFISMNVYGFTFTLHTKRGFHFVTINSNYFNESMDFTNKENLFDYVAPILGKKILEDIFQKIR